MLLKLQVKEATTVEEFRKVFDDIPEFKDLLLETGYVTPHTRLQLDERENVMSVVVDFHCMIKAKAANDQFMDGLRSTGVDKYIQQFPQIMKQLFCYQKPPLTAGIWFTLVNHAIQYCLVFQTIHALTVLFNTPFFTALGIHNSFL